MIQQQFDLHDEKKWDDAVEEQRRRNAWVGFLKDTPEYHMTVYNGTLMQDRLVQLNKPITRRNLGIVFEELSDLNLLQKPWKATPESQPQFIAPDKRASVQRIESTLARPRYSITDSPENRQALQQEIAGRRAAAGGEQFLDPRRTELGRDYRINVKGANIRERQSTATAHQEAVVRVSNANPRMSTRSPEFRKLVANELRGQQ